MTYKPGFSRNYALCLWLLTALFCFRIFAQFIVYFADISLLPPFYLWHSEIMSYWALFLIQIIILIIMIRTNYQYTEGNSIAKLTLGRGLLIFGVVYFAIMLIRLILGLTLFTEERWFTNHIPTFFHFVLASWVLIIGMFHFKGDNRNQQDG